MLLIVFEVIALVMGVHGLDRSASPLSQWSLALSSTTTPEDTITARKTSNPRFVVGAIVFLVTIAKEFVF